MTYIDPEGILLWMLILLEFFCAAMAGTAETLEYEIMHSIFATMHEGCRIAVWYLILKSFGFFR